MPKRTIPRIMHLAEQLEADIRRRGLQSGDAYMNAAEVAGFLRISASTANRVLQILDRRGIVERAQKKGTFISNPDQEQPLHTIERIHMVTFQDSVKQSGLMTEPVIVGIQNSLPGSMIQFNFLPPLGNRDHLRRLLDEAQRSPDPVGVVLTRAPYHAQKMVEASGIPGVIHGYPQPTVTKLAWISIDYNAIGKLCADFVMRKKAKELIQLLPERPLLPGDYRLQRSVRHALAAAGYDSAAFRVCTLPVDEEAVHGWLREEIDGRKSRPIVICSPEFLTASPSDALKRLGLKRTQYEVLVIDDHRMAVDTLPRISSPISDFEVGVHIAELLQRQVRGETDSLHEIFPVELIPEGAT